jgi:hypothetical protein
LDEQRGRDIAEVLQQFIDAQIMSIALKDGTGQNHDSSEPSRMA